MDFQANDKKLGTTKKEHNGPSSASYNTLNNGSAGWGGDPLLSSLHQMARSSGTMNNNRYPSYRSVSVDRSRMGASTLPMARANESVYRSIQMMNHPNFAAREMSPTISKINRNVGTGPMVNSFGKQPQVVVTSQANAQEIRPELPMVPLGPCHFYLRAGVKTIVDYMAQTFEKMDIDIIFRPAKCKWKATAYEMDKEATFRVYMYAHEINGVYAFECQRRTGCARFFNALVKDIQMHLAGFGIVCSENGQLTSKPTEYSELPQAKRLCAMQPPPLAPSLSRPTDVSCLKPLIEMSKSEYAELQTQAFSELLSQCCSKPAVCQVLAKQTDVIVHCVQSLQHGNKCVVRCAASILSLLVGEASCQQLLVRTEPIKTLAGIVSHTTCQPETKRKCLSILSSLCKAGHSQLVLEQVGNQFFNQLSTTSDNRLRMCALETQQLLGVC